MIGKTLEGSVPVIDVGPLLSGNARRGEVAKAIGLACRESGFFYVSGHGVDPNLQRRLEHLSRKFFDQNLSTKMQIAMEKGGKAWRGYFPVGQELTSGKPDIKEGIYFGAELSADHPAVRAGLPLHGSNLFPDSPKELRATVLEYLESMTALAHALMSAIALSLELEADYFFRRYTYDPFVLFRIFNYPPPTPEMLKESWGVGEHTDYGLLTILKQDDIGGLEVKTKSGWIQAPPISGTFVCNIGDMLDRMTQGLYRSTPHRVQNTAGKARLSFPFFFDPAFDAEVEPVPLSLSQQISTSEDSRWDGTNLQELSGTYGEYLMGKVSKVFPDLGKNVLRK